MTTVTLSEQAYACQLNLEQTRQQGINAMFAIKSARDQINSSLTTPKLMLVFTGSNRDKLAQLVLKKDQPFFGCGVVSGYVLYRMVRMLPSLFPPLWWSIPENAVIP